MKRPALCGGNFNSRWRKSRQSPSFLRMARHSFSSRPVSTTAAKVRLPMRRISAAYSARIGLSGWREGSSAGGLLSLFIAQPFGRLPAPIFLVFSDDEALVVRQRAGLAPERLQVDMIGKDDVAAQHVVAAESINGRCA